MWHQEEFISRTRFSNNQDQYKVLQRAKNHAHINKFSVQCQHWLIPAYTVEQALSADDLYKNIDVHAKVKSKQQNKQPILRNGKK